MTTSSYMPDVVVEIAFNAGFSTPAADRVWTDVSDYVELERGINISWGRGDERSTADANQLSLTLDNSDGRFTAGKTSSPYYPNVKLDRPIRVTATPVDGSASTRFLGYVNEWPVEWDGTDAYASASITASSRLARLGLTAALRSIVEETILVDNPVAYYPLGEPAGALQANDASGDAGNPLLLAGDGAAVDFGTATGPGTDDLTAATFMGGRYLFGAGPYHADPGAGLSVSLFFLRNGLPSVGEQMLSDVLNLIVLTDGRLSFEDVIFTAGSVCDNAVHHVVAYKTPGGTGGLYLDGVLVGTAGGLASGSGFAPGVGLGGTASGARFGGSVAHLAIFYAELSAARAAAHAAAGDDGFAGELTDARLERYAAFGGIPAAEVDAAAGSTTMAHVDTTDQQVVELLRTVEAAEGGVLFDARDGTLTMHNRAHRYNAAVAFILDMYEHEVESDYSPRLDRSGILNDVTGSNTAGTVTARVTDDDSIEDYGHASTSFTTASDDDDEPLQKASWLVHTYKEPKSRVPSLSVDVLAQVEKGVNSADILAADVGTKISVSGHPAQMPYSILDYFIEGGSESYGPESLKVTFNLSPTSPYDQTLILGDATRGALGSYALAH